MEMSQIVSYVTSFLAADFTFAAEFQSFLMALQGAMAVKNTSNKNGKMKWFHAFAEGVVIAYAGALFTPFWMGRVTPMLANEMNMAMCIISFLIVNFLPFSLGRKFGNFLPIRLLVISGAQLFRTMGIIKFVNIAHEAFKDSPPPFYPTTPIIGPILFATILSNMGAFFWKGFHGHLQNGMPFPFQNGLFCATLYHFVSNDIEGPVGNILRSAINAVPQLTLGLSNEAFTISFISAFMQVTGMLQIPELFGPSFNPFYTFYYIWDIVKPKAKLIDTINRNQGVKKMKKKKKKKNE